LLKAVKGKLCFIVNKYLERIRHKFLARNPNIFCQCCTEHHDLLVVWCCSENFLNIATHVYWAVSQLDEMVDKNAATRKKSKRPRKQEGKK